MPISVCRVCLIAFAVVVTGCTRMMFSPSDEWVETPDQLGYDYEEKLIRSENGQLISAWLLPQRQSQRNKPKGAVLFFHGKADNISSHFSKVNWLADEGYDVLMVDYRGFGRSHGHAGLSSSLVDIRYSTLWFLDKYSGSTPKYLLGQDYGASMAGYVMATNERLLKPFSAVILDSGFGSYRNLSAEKLDDHWLTDLVKTPVLQTIPSEYDLIDYIEDISPTPLLIVHGTEDTVVPYRYGEALFEQAKEPKQFLSYKGEHIAAYDDVKNRQVLLQFLSQHQHPQISQQ